MKKIALFFSAFTGITLSLLSQTNTPVVKIYAYAQSVVPGVNPNSKAIDESGKEINVEPKSRQNYLIYLEQKKSAAIQPTTIWIKDKNYSLSYDEVKQTPVELSSSNLMNDKKKMELVPKTKNKVLKLILTGVIEDQAIISTTLKKLIAKNNLVISYNWKGKTYYAALKNIKMLEPLAAM
jgi:hypothetical protein